MSKKLADAGARRKIVEELDKTFFIEAGAGSGKTKSLVDRMIALLRAGKCAIGQIAAVTFTRKAAAELRGRFQVELERAVADEKTGLAERERLAAALQNLEQGYIGTIHSFCAKLLRERPIEIGLDPEFSEMEELENDVFRDDCWNEFIVRARIEAADMLRGLDEAGLAPEDLKNSFDSVSLYPEVELVGGRPDIPEYETYRKELEKFLERAIKALPEKRPEKGYDALQQKIRQCDRRRKNIGFGDHRVLMETFEVMDKNPEIKLYKWSSKEAAKAWKAEYDDFRERVVVPALKVWREYRQERIVRFLRPAVRYFEERRKEENRLNYEDLLLHASRLLRDNNEVRQYFSRKYTHMLVDEFQDTDPIQAEVLMYLKGEDRDERDWQKLRPEPGSLFLVGDPKQSIYRFRRADIDIYNLFKRIVEEAGGEVLRLTTNFRSLDVLAEWNNPVWKAVMPEVVDRYQAAFAPLETVRPDGEGCCSGVRKIVVPSVPRNKGEDIAVYDAAVIGDWIRWACAGNIKICNSGDTKPNSQKGPEEQGTRPLGSGNKSCVPIIGRAAQPSDFLILTRYKKNMDAYARALEERGIPFEITGSDAFAGSEEIGEITNLALALNDPENPVCAVAVLRGIFFGVSDQQLLEYKREGGRFNFAMPGKDILQSKKLGAVYVSMALAKLREWRKWTLELPVSAALQKIFEDSGILIYYASLEMGSSRVGNVLKLLEIVRNQERKGITAFAQIVRFMEELSDVREIEEMSLTPARENAVRLMNLHKAKGLEAPIVFLANPVGIKDHDVDKHIIRVKTLPKGTFPKVPPCDGRPVGYFTFSRPGVYGKKGPLLSQPVGWEGAAAEEEKYEAAQEIRLQYVAATRARNILIISTYAGDLKNKAWKKIDQALEGVPELDEVPEDQGGGKRKKLALQKTDVERVRREISAGLESASQPTYAVESVTSLAKKEREAPARRRDTGLGLNWGRLVHQVLEALGSGRLSYPAGEPAHKLVPPAATAKLRAFVENILAADEASFSDAEGLLAHIQAILGSPFWARVMKADKRYFEIPFSIKTSREQLALATGSASEIPIVLTGAIDLVFWEDDGGGGGEASTKGEAGAPGAGWVIVDYKTDHIRPQLLEDDLAGLVKVYAPQIRLYSRFWREITGEPVKEAGLYFTSIDRWVRI
jgi:ATP-dependent helicase/nuclease subunit A